MPAPDFRSSPRSLSSGFPVWLGWIVAAVALPISFFMGIRLMTMGTEVSLARTEAELARAEAQDFRQRLEAGQIIARKQIADLHAARVFGETNVVKLVAPATPAPPDVAAATLPSALLVWHAGNHEGIVWVDLLPPAKADEEYRLWLGETTGNWLAADPLMVVAGNTGKTVFRTEAPLSLRRILVTREPKQSAPAQPVGEAILIGNL